MRNKVIEWYNIGLRKPNIQTKGVDMRDPNSPEVKLTPVLRQVLEKITRCYTNPHWLVLRAKIILRTSAGDNNSKIAKRLDTTQDTTGKWRGRWLEAEPRLLTAETEGLNEKVLAALVKAALSDAPRSGAPDTFTPEQLVQVVAVACENPRELNREISHWTRRELADEMIERKTVDTISPRHVGRILDEADLKPHLSRYWLNNNRNKDPEGLMLMSKTSVASMLQRLPSINRESISFLLTRKQEFRPSNASIPLAR